LDVIRKPINIYLNRNWSPDRSRYATLTFFRNDYIVNSTDMEFPRQSFETVADPAGQALIAIKCSYAGVLQTFFNLGNALLLPSISVTNLIEEFENLNLNWDEVRIKCYADTAIQARLFKLNYDTCDPDADDQFQPPPPPPPLPEVPPGTSIADISPPYDDEPDTAETQPNPIDEFAMPIFAIDTEYVASTNCSVPRISIRYYFGESPTILNQGNPICGGPKYIFQPAPFGFDEGGGFVTPTPGALFDGTSNYTAISAPFEVPDPRL
jgi:hypothetical protein